MHQPRLILPLHPRAQTTCTEAEVLDGEHHRTTGLAPAEYACWNPVEYAWCDDVLGTTWQDKATAAGWALVVSSPPPSPSSPPVGASKANVETKDDDLSEGAVAGIAVGCAIAGCVLGAAAVLVLTKKKATSEVNLAASSPESKI